MQRRIWPIISVSILLASVCTAREAGAEESADHTEVRQLVQDFLKSWETGDREGFSSALHRDLEFAYPGGRLGKNELLAVFERYLEQKRDIRIYFDDEFFFAGDRFAFAYQFAATDRKTGKRQAVGTGVVGRVADGRIVLFKEYYDENVAVLQYEGALPLDEGVVSPWPASVWLRPETID